MSYSIGSVTLQYEPRWENREEYYNYRFMKFTTSEGYILQRIPISSGNLILMTYQGLTKTELESIIDIYNSKAEVTLIHGSELNITVQGDPTHPPEKVTPLKISYNKLYEINPNVKAYEVKVGWLKS